MLNILWPFFIIISIFYAILSGNIENINNCIFEWFMNDLGLIEVCPADKTVRTTRYNTRIDRVFTNMANVTIEIETSFLNISDHAALKIEFEEN